MDDEPCEKCRFMQKIYYFKPFRSNTWTKDWKSVTHRDFVFRDDQWSVEFPEPEINPAFERYVCRKWCDGPHNKSLSDDAYSAQTMPDLFGEPRRAIYSDPRKCSSTYAHDYTWKDDYRPRGRFPGWCLRGNPPEYLDEDRT